ncbi:hypothetical protein LXL04_013616 [Taraxacum kok-saghyz]
MEKPCVRYGCAAQSRKGEDYFMMKTDCQQRHEYRLKLKNLICKNWNLRSILQKTRQREKKEGNGDFRGFLKGELISKEIEGLEVKSRRFEAYRGKKSPPNYKKFVFEVEGRNPKPKSSGRKCWYKVGTLETKVGMCRIFGEEELTVVRTRVVSLRHESCSDEQTRVVSLGHGEQRKGAKEGGLAGVLPSTHLKLSLIEKRGRLFHDEDRLPAKARITSQIAIRNPSYCTKTNILIGFSPGLTSETIATFVIIDGWTVTVASVGDSRVQKPYLVWIIEEEKIGAKINEYRQKWKSLSLPLVSIEQEQETVKTHAPILFPVHLIRLPHRHFPLQHFSPICKIIYLSIICDSQETAIPLETTVVAQAFVDMLKIIEKMATGYGSSFRRTRTMWPQERRCRDAHTAPNAAFPMLAFSCVDLATASNGSLLFLFFSFVQRLQAPSSNGYMTLLTGSPQLPNQRSFPATTSPPIHFQNIGVQNFHQPPVPQFQPQFQTQATLTEDVVYETQPEFIPQSSREKKGLQGKDYNRLRETCAMDRGGICVSSGCLVFDIQRCHKRQRP